MSGLFADASATFTMTFDDGAEVTLRKYADAGIQEELERDMWRFRRRAAQEGEEADANEDGEIEERLIHFSRLKFVQKMLVKIQLPDGGVHHEPFGLKWVQRFTRQAFRDITTRLDEYNPPLRDSAEEEDEDVDQLLGAKVFVPNPEPMLED